MSEFLVFIGAIVGFSLLGTLLSIAGFLVFVFFASLFLRLTDFLANFIDWLIERR